MSREFWWESEKDEVHGKVFDHIRAIEQDQHEIHEANLLHAKLYSNSTLHGLDWTTSGRRHGRSFKGGVSENVVKSVVDTATSMIAKNRPKATFVTDGAEFSMQQRAKKLDKFVFAEFKRSGVYSMAPAAFRDACIFGTGVVKVFGEDGRIKVERIIPDEIVVDESECLCSPTDTRQLHHRRLVDRETLKAMFSGESDFEQIALDIDQAQGEDFKFTTGREHVDLDDNQVIVIESWYLPSSPGAGDGRHTLSIENRTLVDEEWRREVFPFVFYYWTLPVTGFYGDGLAFDLRGIQLRINKLNKFIDRAQDLIARPRIFVEMASKVMDTQITNEVGTIIKYRGNPPVFLTPQAVGQEIYTYKELLKQSAFELAGISRLSAQSRKPVGLESAVALREFNDIETERFAIQAQRYEEMFLEIAEHMIEVAKELNSDTKPLTVFAADGDVGKSIKWSDVDMDKHRYVMKIEASSILSRTPSGRLQQVTELGNAGLISPEEAKRLLDHPDLEAVQTLENAGIEDIEATIEELLDGGQPIPEPFQSLQMGIARVQKAYLRAKRAGAPDNILENMRQWWLSAQALLNPEPLPAPGVPGAQAGAPAPVPGGQPAAAPSPAFAPPPAAVGGTAL